MVINVWTSPSLMFPSFKRSPVTCVIEVAPLTAKLRLRSHLWLRRRSHLGRRVSWWWNHLEAKVLKRCLLRAERAWRVWAACEGRPVLSDRLLLDVHKPRPNTEETSQARRDVGLSILLCSSSASGLWLPVPAAQPLAVSDSGPGRTERPPVSHRVNGASADFIT